MDELVIWGAIIVGGLWARQKSFFAAFWWLMTVMLAIYCGLWCSGFIAQLLAGLSGVLGGYKRIAAIAAGGFVAFLVFYKAGLEREEGNLERYPFPKYFRTIAPILCGMLIGRYAVAFCMFLLCLAPCRSLLGDYCNFPGMEQYATRTLGGLSGSIDFWSFQGGHERRQALEAMLQQQRESGNSDVDLDAKLEQAKADRKRQQEAADKASGKSDAANAGAKPSGK